MEMREEGGGKRDKVVRSCFVSPCLFYFLNYINKDIGSRSKIIKLSLSSSNNLI